MPRLLGPGLCCLLLVAGLCAPAAGQATAPAPRSSLHRLARHAGYIFRGTVLKVEAVRPAAGAPATVQITFAVTDAIRGVRPGQRLVIREWAGLWAAGAPRYRPGQDLLLFLYPRSRLGLTSSVGGDLGIFPVDGQGEVLLRAQQERQLLGGPAARGQERPTTSSDGSARMPYERFAARIRQAATE